MKRRSQPEAVLGSPASAGHPPPDLPGIRLYAAMGVPLDGLTGENAVRRLAIEVLTSRPGTTTELVLTRADAWRLLGIDIGTLQEDRVPGLVLTEDLEQTRAFLSRQTGSRRILVIYGGEAEGIRELRNYGQVAVISLSSPTETPMVGARDHEAPHAVALSGIDCLAPLSKDDAFNQLMSMPTIARLSRP